MRSEGGGVCMRGREGQTRLPDRCHSTGRLRAVQAVRAVQGRRPSSRAPARACRAAPTPEGTTCPPGIPLSCIRQSTPRGTVSDSASASA
eukprot:351694-Chlamydomonas_euryale.AAC.3